MDDLSRTILIMTKEPQAGHVKTRLRPILSDDQCAELSACFLIDTIAKARHVAQTIIVAYSAVGGEGSIFDLVPESIACIKQTGDDLGQRLAAAVEFAESNGGGPIIVIGTDSPTMPPEVLVTALQRLAEPATELVLGETDDGGYYLIGVQHNIPSIFRGIPWSSADVYQATLDQANKIGLTGIVELPKCYDIDTPDDLISLHQEFLKNGDWQTVAPKTAGWLKTNDYLFSPIA